MPFGFLDRGDPLGELRLQSNDSANIFFVEELDHDTPNRDNPRLIGNFHGTVPNHGYQEKMKAYAVELAIENTIIQGYYKDRYLIEKGITGRGYEVIISVWYEEDEP